MSQRRSTKSRYSVLYKNLYNIAFQMQGDLQRCLYPFVRKLWQLARWAYSCSSEHLFTSLLAFTTVVNEEVLSLDFSSSISILNILIS